MAAVESYSPCPCGSGQKYKWCCQKVEPFAVKAQRLIQSGQVEPALKTLDEGLRKEPDSPLLLTRRAVILMQMGRLDEAAVPLRHLLSRSPNHFGARVLLTRCVLETEGPLYGAGMFQDLLGRSTPEQRASLGNMAEIIAALFISARRIPAAIKHLELARFLGDPDGSTATSLRALDTAPGISPWLKDSLYLEPTPSHWTGEGRDRFEEGLQFAREGFWAKAAATFDSVADGEPGGEADHNLGLCRLWLGDQDGAVAPFRRRVHRLGTAPTAVDLEALCQLIEPIRADDRVEIVELSWPLRNRKALLDLLHQTPTVAFEGDDETDPADQDDASAGAGADASADAIFALLDRPKLADTAGEGLGIDDVPLVLGRVTVLEETVALTALDDGRLDALGDRFTVLAGTSIAPAHPRTKILGHDSRTAQASDRDWLLPDSISPETSLRLERDKRKHYLETAWLTTPQPALNWRTPQQAASDPHQEVPLRALLMQAEQAQSALGMEPLPLRSRLGLPEEPTPAPSTVEAVARLAVARLPRVEVASCDDATLLAFYRKTRRFGLHTLMELAARTIVERPSLRADESVSLVVIFLDLATLAASRGDAAGVRDWLAQGRSNDAPGVRANNAALWDISEVRLRARLEPPATWVPELAIVLERYAQDQAASQVLMTGLMEMGLMSVAPNPDDPERLLIDSRPLQALLAEFGPRITTASGKLGVSATRPEVWTPGADQRGGTGIWTPGGASPAPPTTGGAGGPSRLILPGR